MRIQLKEVSPYKDSHPGLLLNKYVVHPADGSLDWSRAKQGILEAAKEVSPSEFYIAAFSRWEKLITESNSISNLLQTANRLIVGLGSESVLETGIRLHYTYGLPIIPGSALKGLAAHFCDQAWSTGVNSFKKPTEAENEAYRKFLSGSVPQPDANFHRLLFGNNDDSGCIVFHDAWFVPDSDKQPLKLDVMTPHHQSYNLGPESKKIFNAPTDFDTPVPVPFLSVSGRFLFALSWHGPTSDQSSNWLELAMVLLRQALFEWGVGGKTSSGYGRFVAPEPPKKRNSNDKATVKILAKRPKGGFDVQDRERDRNPGTLTVGIPPDGMELFIGNTVDVLVHNDDFNKPQYKWPHQTKR